MRIGRRGAVGVAHAHEIALVGERLLVRGRAVLGLRGLDDARAGGEHPDALGIVISTAWSVALVKCVVILPPDAWVSMNDSPSGHGRR